MWLLLAGVAAGCGTVRPTPDAMLVDSIELKGVKSVDEGELKKHILTTQTSFFPGWVPMVGHDRFYDPMAWQADLRRVERYYQALGFYQAKVVEDEVRPIPGQRVQLSLRVDEGGPPVTVTALDLQGLEGLPQEQRETVLKKLPLAVGDIFVEDNWVALKEQIPARLRELGYVEAVVEGEAVVDVEAHTAQLRLQVTAGVRYRMGRIFVSSANLSTVNRETIILQAETAFTPGEWYRESILSEIQGRVFQMGVFSAVRVNRASVDRETLAVDVVVLVTEAPFHSLRFGAGLGLDQVRQEANATVELTHRNFFGGLRRGSIKGKGGYALLPHVVAVAQGSAGSQHGPVFSLHGEFEQPPWNWKVGPPLLRRALNRLSFQFSADAFSGLEPSYSYLGVSAKVGLLWKPTDAIRFIPTYNIEAYPRLSSEIPFDGRAPEQAVGCTAPCPLSYLEQTIEFDKRDNVLEPRSGFYAAVSFQEGGGPLGGQFTFYRIVPEVRGYWSFDEEKRVTLSGKLKLGTLLTPPDEATPIVARFFSGGASSMRGFNSRRLSPMTAVGKDPKGDGLIASAGQREGETLPIGGKGLLEASVELRWNLIGDLVLAVFFDAGFVTKEAFPLSYPGGFFSQLHTAVGFGLRYRTPVGPIRFDLAMRLPNGPGLPVEQNNPMRPVTYPVDGSCFGLFNAGPRYGGSPEGRCVIQFSVGEAF